MKKSFLLNSIVLLISLFFTPFFANAQTRNPIINSTTTTATFCSDGKLSCAPTLIFATSTATNTQVIINKKYKIPKEGLRIAPLDANYSFYPKKLNFSVKDRNILVISRYWQTGCLYDINGEIFIATSTISSLKDKYICMQTATGKKDLPTELGLYNIQTKQNQDYTSTKYSITGKELSATSTEKAAPMPYAMHFGRIIGMGPDQKLWYDFSDGSALHEKQTINKYGSVSFVSHGCIAIEKGKGKFLQSKINYGDLILVVSQSFPNTLDEAISLDK